MRSARAFTLVELTLVLVIIAIIAGVGAPKYANAVAHYRADTAANRLAADLGAAQSQARASSKPQTVTFDTVNSAYTIPVKDLNNASSTTTVSLNAGQYLAHIASVSFNSATQVTFDIYGKPDNGGSVVLQVGSWTKTIVLDPDSGKATVQ
jgi:prepilin-type N-terminal cleavage/methylation domain-containing protein